MDNNPLEQPDWPLEPCAGDTHTDDQGRLWTYYSIGYGERGGRWAYQSLPGGRIVVDTRQNMQSPFFAGMLAIPWDSVTKLGWVLAKAYCQPVTEKLEAIPIDAVRFERLDKPPSQED